MVHLTFITAGGEQVSGQHAGGNLMEIAQELGVEGITADCGGVCSCGTCHIIVDEACAHLVGPATDVERYILDYEENATDRSRLSCQVEVVPEMDGLVVHVPGPEQA